MGNLEINVVPKFLDSALTPVAKEIGDRLGDLVNLAFTPVIKLRMKRDQNLALFSNELNKKISEIPENKLVEPSANLVGPILEDVAKYYHDEEYLREFFSNLIASAMNEDSKVYVHPGFRDLIKDLTAFEANLLQNYFLYEEKYMKGGVENSQIIETKLLFYASPHFYSDEEFVPNLESLSFNYYKAYYLPINLLPQSFKNIKIALQNLERLNIIRIIIKPIEKIRDWELYDFLPFHYMEDLYRIDCSLTTYGEKFMKMCCNMKNIPHDEY